MNTQNTKRHSRSKSSAGRSQGSPHGKRSSGFKKGGSSSRPHHKRRNGGGGGKGRNQSNGSFVHVSSRGKRRIPTFDPTQFINKNPVDVKEEVYVPKHKFTDFDIDPKLSKIVHDLGITTPSPIQDQTIPVSLLGKDVVGLAETGTGKTAAFLIPLIQKTLRDKNHETLILAPTRELVMQIDQEFKKLTQGMKLYSALCVGGVNINPQIKALKRKQHFIIGTPGRIMDLMDRKHIIPQNFTGVVLDEADRMLDMGFIHDIRKIVSEIPKDRQTLLFSATMDDAAEKLIHDFLIDPTIVSVKKKDITNSIEQDVVPFYGEDSKNDTLEKLLKDPEFKKVIIFGGMKYAVEKLSKKLVSRGINSVSIHGNKSHIQRQKALQAFKKGDAQVLVATDVAARGIHVDDVSHVINYDLPQTFEDYVHRIGRTGRGVKRGKALTLIRK